MDGKTNTEQLYTRLLTSADYAEVCALYKSNSSHMGVESTDYHEEHTTDLLMSEYLNPDFNKKVMYGTFLNGQLVLCMGVFFWPDLPFCTFLRFASLRGAFPGRTIRDPFRNLYSACLDALEEAGRHRFYLLSSARHHEMLAYIGATLSRLRQRYIMTVEEVVPSHSEPQYAYVWSMMGYKTWPLPVIVRAGTLLNKYRKIDTSIVSTKALEIWDDTGKD